MITSLRLTILLLTVGVVFRLFLTTNGNFIFHMDSARDFVDVREMVELQKPRLTGPTSAIEGLYNGPSWYYLLAVPYLLFDGHPYGSIAMHIFFWAVGGYFLLKLVERWGIISQLVAGLVWVAGNYIVLATSYSFSPNPVTLLTPLLIYLLSSYLLTPTLLYSSLLWLLAGIFFNLEMNAGAMIPPVIIIALIVSKKLRYLKSVNFWAGVGLFALFLAPQVIFDLRHDFIMTNSVIKYLTESPLKPEINILPRINLMVESFINVFSPTLFNFKTGVLLILAGLILVRLDPLAKISAILILVPLVLYTFIPVTVNPWHLGMEAVAFIILASYLMSHIPLSLKLLSVAIICYLALGNIANFFLHDYSRPNLDPSLFKNEVAAIDYVYLKANGQNFKVYTHLPSVYDYPYQYLFWWHGQKTYGYLPLEYTYQPDKPPYIPSQDRFQNTNLQVPNSDLVFLIIEPQNPKLRELWYNHFSQYPLLISEKVGPLTVETRVDSSSR